MAKKVYIIHGWYDSSAGCWFPWLKKELESKGFAVEAPDMPNTKTPKINEWVGLLKTIANLPNKDTYFVGHSIGCQTILRYIADLPDGTKAGGVLLVAPWLSSLTDLNEEELEIARPWLETPINWGASRHIRPSLA